MKKITILFSALTLMASTLQAQTPIVFDFDTNAIESLDPVNNPGYLSETIDGITLTATVTEGSIGLTNADGWAGITGNAFVASNNSEVLITFSEPVVVNSVLALDGQLDEETYVFTPTGGEGNEPVEAFIEGGTETVSLNWIGVTSFTVTYTNFELLLDSLSVYPSNTPTVFDFDTNTTEEDDDILTPNRIVWQTIDGITLTASVTEGTLTLPNDDGYGGIIEHPLHGSNNSEVLITFSEPVVVNSVLALDGQLDEETYVFTPTGGEGNEPVVAFLEGGTETVILNWIGVTSFTVTYTNFGLYLDNLSVQSMDVDGSLSVETPSPREQVKVYPNPVQNTLYIKNSTDIQSVTIYSITGQQVYAGNNTTSIDVSNLSKGMYLLKLKTTQGTEVVKRIIKN